MESRKKIIAIIGTSSASKEVIQAAEQLGTLIIDNGFRIISGGLSGVMEAVSRGARNSLKHQDGDIIGILPGFNKSDANAFVDIVIPTGFGFARNLIIVTAADLVVATDESISTKIGTLDNSNFKKSIGWSSIMGNLKLDETRNDKIHSAKNPEEVISMITEILTTINVDEKKKLRY
ncbi:MAG: TIGR00725 family protein [Promethearchaeota archaeon]